MTTVPLRLSNPVVAPHTSSTNTARMGSGLWTLKAVSARSGRQATVPVTISGRASPAGHPGAQEDRMLATHEIWVNYLDSLSALRTAAILSEGGLGLIRHPRLSSHS